MRHQPDRHPGSAKPPDSATQPGDSFLKICRRIPSQPSKIGLVLAINAVLIALDHLTKWWAVVYLRNGHHTWDSPGSLIRIVYAENTGAFLSLGGGLPEPWRLMIMIGLNTVLLAGITLWLAFRRDVALWTAVALSLVLAGGLGNLLDRIFRPGHVVVDFMNLGITTPWFSLRTGIFNIADLGIMGGLVMLLAWELLLKPRPPGAAPK